MIRSAVAIPRWSPPVPISAAERKVLDRVRKKRRLFAFLREHRHRIFDAAFQDELEGMYRGTGAGKKPVAPALMAMVLLLQAYSQASDAEAVELAACDARWQLCLGTLGDDPPFSQGALFDFRERLIKHDMDRRLLERTVEFARESGAFDWKKLPKDLRVAVDSSPLHGAGRVEDSIGLLARAAWKIVLHVAERRGKPAELIADELGIPVLAAPSIKGGLDVDWTLPDAVTEALNRLLRQIVALEEAVRSAFPDEIDKPPLSDHLALLEELRTQDLEPDPTTPSRSRIRRGTAENRRISIEDSQMRHGRKSPTKAFDGFKRHVGIAMGTGLVLAADVHPANAKENVGLEPVHRDIERQGLRVVEYAFDRGYISSSLVPKLLDDGVAIFSKAWTQSNDGRYTKNDFRFDLRAKTVTCPAGETERFRPGKITEFNARVCDRCSQRSLCTTKKKGRGRQLQIHPLEELQERFRRAGHTRSGREKLRERVEVEHRLAHLSQRQSNDARYLGTRKNTFDVRRHAAVMNLEVVQAELIAQQDQQDNASLSYSGDANAA